MSKLIIIKGPVKDQIIELIGDTVFLGRTLKNDVQVKDNFVSGKHLKIFTIGKTIFIEDLKSTNGTMINGEFIEPGEGVEVGEGDLITIGKTVMRLTEAPVKKSLDKKKSNIQKARRKPASKGESTEERRSRSPRDIELIYKVSELLKKSQSINRLLEKLLEHLLDAFPRIDTAAIFLFRNGKSKIMEVISRSKLVSEKSVTQYSQKILARVIRDRKIVRMSNTAFESPDDYADSMDTSRIESVMCVPIIIDKEILGAIYVDSIKGPYGFRKEDQLLLNSMTGPLAVAIEKDRVATKFEE